MPSEGLMQIDEETEGWGTLHRIPATCLWRSEVPSDRWRDRFVRLAFGEAGG